MFSQGADLTFLSFSYIFFIQERLLVIFFFFNFPNFSDALLDSSLVLIGALQFYIYIYL